MPRRPFLSKYRGTPWKLGIELASEKMLAQIGSCVARWAFVEHNLALCLGFMLGSDSPAALSLFSALRQGRNQHRALTEAAEALEFSQHDLDIIEASLQFIRSAEKARNELAHGEWGTIAISAERCFEMRPDALIWIEQKHVTPWNTQALLSELGTEFERPEVRVLERRLFVYEEADLAEVRDLIERAFRVSLELVMFIKAISPQGYGEPDGPRALLCSEPQILEALNRLFESRNSQKAP
jgi:hypothetical protein